MSYKEYVKWKTGPLKVDPYLSIVIPAYNEEERIIPTIGAIASHISSLGFPWELIVADDGSTDKTVEILKKNDLANVRILEADQNGGKGNAVQRGVLASRGEFILFSDADNSTPIEEFSKLITKCRDEGFDLAIGSRAAQGAEEANKSWVRHLLSGGLRLIVKHALNIGVKDTQCGFKMYRREAGINLHQTQKIMGFSFDLEILYLANKFGYKIAEVPVHWMDSPGSKVDMRKEIKRFIEDLWRIKRNDWRGEYEPARKLKDSARSHQYVSTG